MSVVTKGIVSIEDGTKKSEEYSPPRKVRVELHFDVAEGQEPEVVLAQVSDIAEAQVRRLLGARPTEPAVTATETAGSTATQNSAPATAEKRKAGPRAAPKAEGKPAPINVVLKDEPKADPSAVTEEVVDDFSAPAAAPATATQITDAELQSAAQKKNGEIKAPVKIRELVGKYKPAGHSGAFQLIEIPQAKRKEFLEALAALTA